MTNDARPTAKREEYALLVERLRRDEIELRMDGSTFIFVLRGFDDSADAITDLLAEVARRTVERDVVRSELKDVTLNAVSFRRERDEALEFVRLAEQQTRNTTAKLRLMEAERDEARAAATALCDKLDAINAHPTFKSIWPFLAIHSFVYDGPDWSVELQEARDVLAKDKTHG